jgi:GTPase involved in cell partitioning and DNA repair
LLLASIPQPDPEKSYASLRNELLRYDPVLLERPSVLALTKCDLIEGGIAGVDPELLKIHSKVLPISSLSREGLNPLLTTLKETMG